MATSCFFCQKKANHGNNVSHAKNRTKRLRKPNLHAKNLTIEGIRRKVSICSRCLSKLKVPVSAQAPAVV